HCHWRCGAHDYTTSSKRREHRNRGLNRFGAAIAIGPGTQCDLGGLHAAALRPMSYDRAKLRITWRVGEKSRRSERRYGWSDCGILPSGGKTRLGDLADFSTVQSKLNTPLIAPGQNMKLWQHSRRKPTVRRHFADPRPAQFLSAAPAPLFSGAPLRNTP